MTSCCSLKGFVRMLVITKKQYSTIELLVGQPTPYDKLQQFEQLMIFGKNEERFSLKTVPNSFSQWYNLLHDCRNMVEVVVPNSFSQWYNSHKISSRARGVVVPNSFSQWYN